MFKRYLSDQTFSSLVFCNRVTPQISFSTTTVIKKATPLKEKSLYLPPKQEVVVNDHVSAVAKSSRS